MNWSAKKLPKHHYIPSFYTSQWTAGDGRICELSRPYKKVVPRRTAPDGTGYVRGLYRLPNVPDEKAEIIERKFMHSVDNGAAVALQALLNPTHGLSNIDDRARFSWARFLYCLILRSPEYLGAVEAILRRDCVGALENARERYDQFRTSADPECFDEFKSRFLANPLNTSAARIINRLVDSDLVIRHICEMSWNVVRFDHTNHLLMTSDRPVIMTNGMTQVGAHIGIPLSPSILFVAFHDDVGYRNVRSLTPLELLRNVNTRVVEQACKYVYAFSDADISFVEAHLGRRVPSTPLETAVLQLARRSFALS